MTGNMTSGGISATSAPGDEKYEFYTVRRQSYCQYDYRHTDGELFSCVKMSLMACRAARNDWLAKKRGGRT